MIFPYIERDLGGPRHVPQIATARWRPAVRFGLGRAEPTSPAADRSLFENESFCANATYYDSVTCGDLAGVVRTFFQNLAKIHVH